MHAQSRALSLTDIASLIARQSGWRAAALAFASGSFATLALAPLDLWPVMFFCLPVLVWLLDGAYARAAAQTGRRRAALVWRFAGIGWWFGFGYFLMGLYWIGFAFFVEADKFALLLPLGVIAFPAVIAAFYALATAAAAPLWRPGPSRIIALALTVFAAEWLRGHILTGFPWNLIGYTLTGAPVLMQAAALVSVYGLSFLAIIIFASPASLAEPAASPQTISISWRWLLPGLALALLATGAGWGAWRLHAHPPQSVPQIALRIVQANIAQKNKWAPEHREPIFRRYLGLSSPTGDAANAPAPARTQIVIWPESAVPFLLLLNGHVANEKVRAQLSQIIPKGGYLITGAERADTENDANGAPHISAVYNSVVALNDEGRRVALYDKVHLVPFGEYLPAQPLLEAFGLRQLTHLPGAFAAGKMLVSERLSGVPRFTPLICYEAIFPGRVTPNPPQPHPAWLLNVTNDAWFGKTAGPHQHLRQARLRAVEEGVPLVRAANTGISAIIDPLGRIIARTKLDQATTLDARLPLTLPPTLFARYGGSILVILVLAGIAAYLAFRMTEKTPIGVTKHARNPVNMSR